MNPPNLPNLSTQLAKANGNGNGRSQTTTTALPNESLFIMDLARELSAMAFAGAGLREVREFLLQKLAQASNDDGKAIIHWMESFQLYEKELVRRRDAAGNETIYTYPWESWNDIAMVPEPGMLMVIGGADGVGKTTVAEKLAEAWAYQGAHVLFFHFELHPNVMFGRRAARHARVNYRAQRMNVNDALIYEVKEAHRRMAAWDGEITYVHSPGWTVPRLQTVLERVHAEKPVDFVIVDYLQKIHSTRHDLAMFGADKWARHAYHVEQLKTIAEIMPVPVILLSQLRKDAKSIDLSNLTREHILGPGDASNAVNIIALLHRPRTEDEGTLADMLSVKFDKNTVGPNGVTTHFLVGEFFDITDVAYQEIA